MSAGASETYNIVLYAPSGYQHVDVFLEMAMLLYHSFQSLGVPCRVSRALEPNAVNVVLGYHLIENADEVNGFRYVVYQLEQLESASWVFGRPCGEVLRRADAVWDYSLENVDILRRKGIDRARHLPIGFHDAMKRIRNAEKDIDVVFYGSLNPRRIPILESLRSRCQLHILYGAYGDQRDEIIARSKIVLNIHAFDARVMEQVRIAYLFNNRCFVLSEDSPANPYASVLAVAPYDGLIDACQHFLEQPEERYRYAKAGYHWLKERPMSDLLRSVLTPNDNS